MSLEGGAIEFFSPSLGRCHFLAFSAALNPFSVFLSDSIPMDTYQFGTNLPA
jgi:hypothetical protein